MTYSEKLKHPKWQRKRLEIMSRDKFKCKLCSDEESTLHVHHKKYTKGADPWEYNNADLITLCASCHEEIEDEEFKGINFSDIKVLKLNNWVGGSSINFISKKGLCSLKVLNDNGDFVCGYNFTNDIAKQVISVLKKSL